jgi:hypothetical protein
MAATSPAEIAERSSRNVALIGVTTTFPVTMA